MSHEEDLYELLGVSREAGPDEIKTAWRGLARELHPDRNRRPNAAARFGRIAAAYAVLSDPDCRLVYDRLGPEALSSGLVEDLARTLREHERPENPRPRARRPASTMDDLVGGPRPRGQRTVRRGADLHVRLHLTPGEARRGGWYHVQVFARLRCGKCEGTGMRRCGRFCLACRGQGRLGSPRTLRVRVPPRASRVTLRLAGEGLATPYGRRGDVFVRVAVLAS